MKAVILAAGAATRMRPLTDDRPKCLLPVAGVPILKRAVTALAQSGFEEFVVVTGYLENRIDAAVRDWFPRLRFELVRNAAWNRTNNAYSLLLARSAVASDSMLLVDGDVLFDPRVVDKVLSAPESDCFALRRTSDLGEEEMKAELDEQGRLAGISKTIACERAAGESVGFWRLTRAVRPIFEALAERVEERGLVDEWYESAFDQAVRSGVAIHAVDVAGLYIGEVDTPSDLAQAERELFERGLA